MDPDFWRERWKKNEIGFHQSKPNALLAKHFDTLALPKDSRIFLPLCGKTLDIAWLLGKGYRVAGAELSELAIEQLFKDLGVEPEISNAGALKRYSAPDIDIFVGNIFDLRGDHLGPIDAVYDRAALVALPEDMRGPYTQHVIGITGCAPQFLLCFEYDQSEMAGPPFSIFEADVKKFYSGKYDATFLDRWDLAGGLKGRVAATETAWRLKKRK
ncbi:MAG: thiopurine S-methyltransferase [Sneathiella sp.]|nr:thiopurine S-methyltransferase [Sneathiella sp.]